MRKNKNWPALFKQTTLPDRLAVGVSGGADSMALLHMLCALKPNRLVALTVDHGLRVESATEAQQVANYCQALGVEHHILTWTDEKPRSGVQNKARMARRQLLIDQCHKLNIADLYLGHQADDQIETMLQRLMRGSGPQGLGGMVDKTVQQGTTIHRPLLHLRRQAVRDYCGEHSIPFIDDPSNEDMRFERIRWRHTIKQIETTAPGFGDGLLRSQKRLQDAAQAVSALAQQWIRFHVHDNDKIVLPRAFLSTQPHAVIVEILRQLMTTDKAYRVDLERIEEWVAQGFSATPVEMALTLDRWWLQIKKDSIVLQLAPDRKGKTA